MHSSKLAGHDGEDVPALGGDFDRGGDSAHVLSKMIRGCGSEGKTGDIISLDGALHVIHVVRLNLEDDGVQTVHELRHATLAAGVWSVEVLEPQGPEPRRYR